MSQGKTSVEFSVVFHVCPLRVVVSTDELASTISVSNVLRSAMAGFAAYLGRSWNATEAQMSSPGRKGQGSKPRTSDMLGERRSP